MPKITMTPLKITALIFAIIFSSVLITFGLIWVVSYRDMRLLPSEIHREASDTEVTEQRQHPPELRVTHVKRDNSAPIPVFSGEIKNESEKRWEMVDVELFLHIKGLQIELRCSDQIKTIDPQKTASFSIVCRDLQTQAWPAEMRYQAVVSNAYVLNDQDKKATDMAKPK